MRYVDVLRHEEKVGICLLLIQNHSLDTMVKGVNFINPRRMRKRGLQ